MTLNRALLVAALVLFVLAFIFTVVGFTGNGHAVLTWPALVSGGLACWAAAHLV